MCSIMSFNRTVRLFNYYWIRNLGVNYCLMKRICLGQWVLLLTFRIVLACSIQRHLCLAVLSSKVDFLFFLHIHHHRCFPPCFSYSDLDFLKYSHLVSFSFHFVYTVNCLFLLFPLDFVFNSSFNIFLFCFFFNIIRCRDICKRHADFKRLLRVLGRGLGLVQQYAIR